MTHTVVRKLCAMAIAGAAVLGSVAPANAIIVSGSWDPRYGSPFVGGDSSSSSDDMWWSGSALFNISDSCALTAGSTLTAANCGSMFISNAQVLLTLDSGGTTLSTLDFGGTIALTSVHIGLDGNVAWVESDWWNPLVSGTGSTFDLGNYYFSLGFSAAGANLFHTEKTAFLDSHGSHGPDERTFFWNGNGTGHLGELCGPTTAPFDGDRCGFSDVYGAMTFSPIAAIPEPSTYALMIAGLGAVGFMSRRRRQQSA